MLEYILYPIYFILLRISFIYIKSLLSPLNDDSGGIVNDESF